jgi:hypothetical protein
MSSRGPQHDVVLRSDLPPRERDLLEHACCKITSNSGPDVYLVGLTLGAGLAVPACRYIREPGCCRAVPVEEAPL